MKLSKKLNQLDALTVALCEFMGITDPIDMQYTRLMIQKAYEIGENQEPITLPNQPIWNQNQ